MQGQDIERELYLLPPPEFRKLNPGVVWRVVKRVYGLKDAPRGWWLEVDSALKELGCTRIQLDHAFYIYTHRKTGDILSFVLSHVDDFLYGGTELFHTVWEYLRLNEFIHMWSEFILNWYDFIPIWNEFIHECDNFLGN